MPVADEWILGEGRDTLLMSTREAFVALMRVASDVALIRKPEALLICLVLTQQGCKLFSHA